MAALDWLQSLLGGGQYGDPSIPAMPTTPLPDDALTRLRAKLGQGAASSLYAGGGDVQPGLNMLGRAVVAPALAGGAALEATMTGPAVSAAEMLQAAMMGITPTPTRLPGGVPSATPTTMERLWADESGALRLTPAQRRQQQITLDTPLASLPDDVIPTPLIPNTPPPKFPQYAEAYPETGPPVWKLDKKTGEDYLAKQLTPEALAFKKERDRIVKDMDRHGFEPYFDPAQRSNVDPSYYPANLDTASIVPVNQVTIDRHMATIGSPESRARLQAAYQRGSEMPNTSQWYAMKQLEDEFIKVLGPVDGRKAFQDKFATSMAATTGGANPESNFLMSSYGNYLRENGLPYPEKAYEMPFPIGGRYASGNMEQHQKIFDAGGFSSLGAANPKRHDFSQAFTGNPNVVTMDEQMTSGMVPGLNVPNWYGLHQRVAREEAAKAGALPRDFQDVAWGGFKNPKDPKYAEGQPMIQTVNESIERTHRLTGMPREEIVRRGIIEGKIPMYGLLGAVGLGAAAGRD